MDIDRLFAPFLLPEDEPSEETERAKAEVRKFLAMHDNLHRIVSSTEFLRAAVNNAAALAVPVRAIPNDREKFNDWLDACPVEVTEVKSYAFGTVQVLFKLPLDSNTEVFVSMEPSARGVSGHWNDVVLYRDDVQTIETYLRCFAPWVFEERED